VIIYLSFMVFAPVAPDKAGTKQAMATRPSFSSLANEKIASLTADDVKGNHARMVRWNARKTPPENSDSTSIAAAASRFVPMTERHKGLAAWSVRSAGGGCALDRRNFVRRSK